MTWSGTVSIAYPVHSSFSASSSLDSNMLCSSLVGGFITRDWDLRKLVQKQGSQASSSSSSSFSSASCCFRSCLRRRRSSGSPTVVTGRNVEHDRAEPQQTLVSEAMKRYLPRVFLPEGTEVLIGDAQRVILAIPSFVASLEQT